MINQKITLDRAGDDLIAVTMQIEGVAAALTALASDQDGLRLVTPVQAVRALEMLSSVCDGAVHKLGIVHDLIESAAEGEEGTQNE